MKTYGLIGYRLGHSFSRGFFTTKFADEGLSDHEYVNFELDDIQHFPDLFRQNDHISGLNCTIPYKQQVMAFLDGIDEEAAQAGAVNTIKVIRENGTRRLIGYNTDIYGFEWSFRPLLKPMHRQALILGTGGASKAVRFVLKKIGMPYLSATTKEKPGDGEVSYADLNARLIGKHPVIIQTTPLGMYPHTDACPDIPYRHLTSNHLLYDLIYNPEETLFMKKGKEQGATVKGGLEMLHLQAIRSWEIWNE